MYAHLFSVRFKKWRYGGHIFSSIDFCQAELISYQFVQRLAVYVNFFKSLLLLHFLLYSFETRYTFFLGQSPNFAILRILKF